MAEAQQGGNSFYHLGRQSDPDTIIDDPRLMSRLRRQFTEFSLDPTGETQQSESIGGSIFGRKSQPGRLGGTGRIGTEVFNSGMLDIVQVVSNGDPEVQSTDVAETTVYDGKVTPTGEAAGATILKVITSGTAEDGEILITQPTTPGQLKITLADATGSVIIRGARQTGLNSILDIEPMEEKVDLDDTDHTGFIQGYFHEIHELEFQNEGLTVGTETDLEIKAMPKLKSTVFRERSEIPKGLTVQGRIGKEHRLGMTGIVTGAQLNVADTIRLSADLLFRVVRRRRTVAGGIFQESLVDVSDLGDDPFIPNVFFPDYGGFLVIDGEPTLFDDYTLDFNWGIRYQQGKSGEQHQSGMEREDSGAEISGSITLDFKSASKAEETFIRWDQRYKDNEVAKIELYMYYWRGDGKRYMQKVTLYNVELTEIPTTPVNSRGTIKEQLSIRAIAEGADPVIEWEVLDDDGWFGVTPLIDFDDDKIANSASTTATIKFQRAVGGSGSGENFEIGDIDASAGSLGSFTKVSDSQYTVEVTAPATGADDIVLTVAKNAVPQGNAETSAVIAYGA